MAQAGHLSPEVEELLLHLPALGQAVFDVLPQIAVLDAELLRHEAFQRLLRGLHAPRAIGAGDHGPLAGHAPQFSHELLAPGGTNVFEGIEACDDIEGLVPEGQLAAITQHQTALVGSLHIHQRDVVMLKKLSQDARAPADIEDSQGLLSLAQPLQDIRYQAIALVLIEG